jgi:hypothetical protein
LDIPVPARFAGRAQGSNLLDLLIEKDQGLLDALISLPEEPIPVTYLSGAQLLSNVSHLGK